MFKALIVDDEPATFEVLSDLIKDIDNSIKVLGLATTKDEALNAIKNLTPDVVFLDINLPGCSGFDILDHFPARNFKVVFVTGYENLRPISKKHEDALFITKPIDKEELRKIIQKVKNSS